MDPNLLFLTLVPKLTGRVSHGQYLLPQSLFCLRLNLKKWDCPISEDAEDAALWRAAGAPTPISLSPMLIRT